MLTIRVRQPFLAALLVLVAVGCLSIIARPARASAATLMVDGNCTIAESIDAINAAANGDGCIAAGAYGTDDTINLPAGTQTLSADLPDITEAVRISGASTATTIIDANGHTGFQADFSSNSPSTKNITIEKLSISGARPLAIDIVAVATLTLDKLDITNSGQALNVDTTTHIILSNSVIHDNTDTSDGDDVVVGARLVTGTAIADQQTSLLIEGTKIVNNSGDAVGIWVGPGIYRYGSGNSDLLPPADISIRNSQITGNQAKSFAGLLVLCSDGPLSAVPVELSVEATTVANNSVEVVTPVTGSNTQTLPVISGFMFSGALTDIHHFTNVTVAFNTVINPSPDDRRSVAGFNASLGAAGSNLNILNTTVVGNTTTQGSATMVMPAFFATKVGLDDSYQVDSFTSGSSATNVLIAQNKFNGVNRSCLNDFDTAAFGINLGIVDVTPVNLGHNMVDDQTCSNYQYVANLYDTVAHEVANNGGSVPTVRLLPGSPAIDGGGQVLGVTTDARGVARSGYYSVGAYQGELLAASTTKTNQLLADTGGKVIAVVAASATLMGAVLMYTYMDYRKHRKPLVEADPHADQTYTYRHHMKAVTLPLLRYRVHITFNRQPTNISRF